MTPTKDIDVAIDACRGADGTVDARRMAAALATPARATEAPSRSLAEIGRDAARKAQREALLATLEACGWNLSEAARRLRLGAARNTLRLIPRLGLSAEYDEAKAMGKITHDPRPRVVVPLTQAQGRAMVGA